MVLVARGIVQGILFRDVKTKFGLLSGLGYGEGNGVVGVQF
jgi:hypothetical protein